MWGLSSVLMSCASSQVSSDPPVGTPSRDVGNFPVEGKGKGTPGEPQSPAAEEGTPQTSESSSSFRLELGQPLSIAGGTIELESYVTEEIAASPVDPEAYPAGSGVTISLRLRGAELAFSDLSQGYDSVRVVYVDGFRAELVSHDPSQASVVVRVDRVLEDEGTLIRPKQRVQVGQRARVEPGFEMEFLGHGHKRTYAGQISPLIVHMRYESAGQPVVEASHNVFEPYVWTWQRYKFEIISHDYGDNMVLRISELELAPLSPGSD